MPEHVLDASATLALLLQETDGLEDLFGADRAVVSSVNLAEIFTRLVDEGWPQAAIQTGIGRLAIDIIDFDERQALDAGLLRAVTRSRGLSLGDRASLALARHLDLPVYTADRVWADLDVGVEIRLLR